MVDAIAAGAGSGRGTGAPLVLDVATGTAGVAIQEAQRLGARVVGADLSADMLAGGARRVDAAGLAGRISLVRTRGEALPFPDRSFDALTFTYLLRYVDDPAAAVAELARVVRPGGVISNLEFHVPPNPFWRGWWWLYSRVVLPLAGLLTGGPAWFAVGRFLGPNISGHYRRHPLPAHVAMWEAAGITDVHVELMSLGGGLVMWGRRGG
jgi:demethylmenaquinone methyltransferase / 2-methoxy-6-polyprenyl-1,4-benzoquinol methylase